MLYKYLVQSQINWLKALPTTYQLANLVVYFVAIPGWLSLYSLFLLKRYIPFFRKGGSWQALWFVPSLYALGIIGWWGFDITHSPQFQKEQYDGCVYGCLLLAKLIHGTLLDSYLLLFGILIPGVLILSVFHIIYLLSHHTESVSSV